MKQNHTDIAIVLDRSGSMVTIHDDTIGGFNQFLEDQQKAEGEATLTLVQFDHEYEVVYDNVPIKEVKPLSPETFVPRGSTALLDAIGRTINSVGARLAKTPEQDRPKKVICVVITDGHENASKEFTRDKVFEMITHQREKYSWEFVFMGANQDAINAGMSMGISAQNSLTYSADGASTRNLYGALSQNVSAVRSGHVGSMAWTDQQRSQVLGGSH